MQIAQYLKNKKTARKPLLLKFVDDKSKRLVLLQERQRSPAIHAFQGNWLHEALMRLRKGIQDKRNSASYLDPCFKDGENHVRLHDSAGPCTSGQPKDVLQTAKAQDMLRAQSESLVARLYGITDTELAHLLRSFKVMAGKRPE